MTIIDLGALWLVVWLIKNAAMDVSCAVKGTPNPRYELKKAKARAAGQAAPTQPRYGTRDWFADLLSDGLQAQTERRRRQAEARRREREQADAEQAEQVEAAKPAAAAKPSEQAGDPAVKTSDPGAGGAPGPEQPNLQVPRQPTAEPTAKVIPFPNTKEDTVSSTVNGEVVGLDQSIAYASSLASFAGEHGSAGNEGYIGHLTKSKITGAGLSSAHDMQEAFANAAAAADRHAQELAKQRSVQEQYDANPDAGDKEFQTQGR